MVVFHDSLLSTSKLGFRVYDCWGSYDVVGPLCCDTPAWRDQILRLNRVQGLG